jgi:hypothetical protein
MFITNIGPLEVDDVKVGLGLWCLTPLSTIFQLYRGGIYSVYP